MFLIIAVEKPKLISVDSCKTNDCTSIGSLSIIIHSNISNKWSNMIMYVALRCPLDLTIFLLKLVLGFFFNLEEDWVRFT